MLELHIDILVNDERNFILSNNNSESDQENISE